MDTDTITHISICSGYGGIDLGLKRAIGEMLRTVAYVEIEAYAVANLVAKAGAGFLDDAPVFSDIKLFPWGAFHGLVDILSGGYPCQPFSAAGKRLGAEDPRHLWPFIANGIRLLRPNICFFENVEGHISLGLEEVIGELEGLGYQTTWGIFSAREVGFPHQRKRIFILAVAHGYCALRLLDQSDRGGLGETQAVSGEHRQAVADSRRTARAGEPDGVSGKLQDLAEQTISATADRCAVRDVFPARPGQPQHEWEPPRVVGNAKDKRCGRMDIRCGQERFE